MKASKSGIKLLLIVVCCCALIACAQSGKTTAVGADQDFITDSYNTLNVSGKAVDGAMSTIGSLYKMGQFGESDKAKAVTSYNAFRTSYNQAVDALTFYASAPSPSAKSAVQTALANVAIQSAAVTALAIIQSK